MEVCGTDGELRGDPKVRIGCRRCPKCGQLVRCDESGFWHLREKSDGHPNGWKLRETCRQEPKQ